MFTRRQWNVIGGTLFRGEEPGKRFRKWRIGGMGKHRLVARARIGITKNHRKTTSATSTADVVRESFSQTRAAAAAAATREPWSQKKIWPSGSNHQLNHSDLGYSPRPHNPPSQHRQAVSAGPQRPQNQAHANVTWGAELRESESKMRRREVQCK